MSSKTKENTKSILLVGLNICYKRKVTHTKILNKLCHRFIANAVEIGHDAICLEIMVKKVFGANYFCDKHLTKKNYKLYNMYKMK